MPITTTIDPPLPGDSPEVFDAKAFAAWAALAGLGAEINASSAEMTTKVNQAAGSATAAANSANAADASRATADASKNAAAASASTATTKASEADASKIAAAASATTASNAATAADASKTAAAGSATTATTKAGEAAASATTASGAATTATTKAGEASNSATTASAAATTATTKAGEASASATTASNAATAATTKASEASNSATTATTKAGEASASASAAEQAKLDAQAAAQQAAGGGEPTIIAGNTGQYWRGDKTWRDFFADVRAATLASLSTATNAVVTATDTVLSAIGKLQAQISAHFGQGGTAHANASTSVAGFMSGADKTKLDGVATSAAAVGSAAGSALGTAAAGSATTSARSDHVHPMPTAADVGASPTSHSHSAATTGAAGFMAAADKSKLDGIATGATANATDAALRDRSTHTGAQAQSTVTNLTTDLAARVNRQDSYATVSSGVINLGLETELYHMTVSGNVTVSVSNAPTTARVVKRLIVQYSSGVVTWPASFRLPTPMPTFAAGKAYVFSIEQSPNSGVYFLVPGPEYTYP